MKNFYCQFSAFFLCLLTLTQFGYATSLYSDFKNPLIDRNKVENIPAKDKEEIGGKNDRPKKEDIPVNPSKPKRKNTVVLPVISSSKTEDVKGITTSSLALLPMKGIQPLITNLSNQKMVGPDPFRFTISSNKDTIAVGEEIELTVTVDWVDFGVNNGVRFLPEWYKYALKVVMPKGFLQSGGDYTDYCTKLVDANNPQAVFMIKGKFEYASEDAKFLVLRGFEGADEKSDFIFKGETKTRILSIITNSSNFKFSSKNSRVAVDCSKTENKPWIMSNGSIDKSSYCNDNETVTFTFDIKNNTSSECSSSVINLINGRFYMHYTDGCFSSQSALDNYLAGFDTPTSTKDPNEKSTSSKINIATGSTARVSIQTTFRVLNIIAITNDIDIVDDNGWVACVIGNVVIPPFTQGFSLTPLTQSALEGTSASINVTGNNGISISNIKYRKTGTSIYVPVDNSPITFSNIAKSKAGNYNVKGDLCNTTYEYSCDIFVKLKSPLISVVPSTAKIASGGTATITASGCSTENYYWSTGETTAEITTPTLTTSTTYLVKCKKGIYDNYLIDSDDTSQLITVDPCANTTLDLTATVTDATCGNTDGQIAVAGSGGTSPYQYKKGATETYQTPTAPATNYTFTNLTNGSYTIYVKDSQGCEKSVTKSVGVSNGPDDPTETAGGSRKGPGSIDLTAKCQTGITVTWYNVDKNGTALATGGTYPTGTISASADYYVSCKSSTCESGRKKVTAIILPLDCDNNTPKSPSISNGSHDGEGTVTIYASCTSSSPKWYDANNVLKKIGSSSIDDSYTTPTISVTTKYYASCVTTVGSSQCESGTVEVTATINPINNPCANSTPSKPTKTDGSNEGSGIVTMTATCVNSNTEWYDASAGGNTLKTANNSSDNTYSRYQTATTIYYAACVSSNGCKSDRISVTSNILSTCASTKPSSPSTTDDSREGAGAVTVRANCQTSGSTAQWYASNTSTTLLWSGGDYSTTISSTKTFYASCLKGSCETSRVGATATILDISNPCDGNAPPTPSVTSGTNEGTGNVNIYGACNGNLTRWYTNSSGGSPLKTASSSTDDLFITQTISVTTTFYAVCLNNSGCESGRVGVAAVILPPCSTRPIAPACTENSREGAGSITIYANCNNQTTPSQVGATTRWYDANNNVIGNGEALTVNNGTTTTYLASCVKGNCESSRSGVRAIINPCATPTPSPTNKANCGPGTFLLWASCPTNLRGKWYSTATSSEVLRDNDQNNNSLSVTLSSSRLYYTSCVNPSNNCESERVGVWAIILPTTLSTATDVEVCQGSAINLQASNTDSFVFGGFAQPLTKVSAFEWKGPNSYASNVQNPIISSAQASNNGIFTSKITNTYSHFLLNGGVQACVATATASVTVYLKPTTFPILTPPLVCRNEPGILTATNCTSPNSVLWYDSPSASVAVGGGLTYHVLIPDNQDNKTFYADCSSKPELQCNSPRASQVVSPLPAPPAPTNAKANKTNTCIGSSVTLSGSCPVGQTIQWFNADNNTTRTILTFNLSTLGANKYYAGCQDNTTTCKTQVANRKEITVTVAPFPLAPIATSASATTLACNSTTPLTFNGTCSTGQSLRWYSDLGGIITNEPGNYDYYLACQDNVSQCATPVANRIKTTITITKPPLTVAPAFNACAGNSLSLLASGTTTYEWNGPNGFAATGSDPTIGVAVPEYNNGFYTITGKAGPGCTATATTLVTVQPQIKLTTPKAYINVCEGGTINLDVLGATTYQWTGPNGYNSVLSSSVISNATVAMSGTYEVVGTTGDCSGFTQIEVKVSPAPTNIASLGLLIAPTTTTINAFPKQIVSLEAKVCPDCYVEWYEKSTGDFQFIPDLGARIYEIQKNVAGTYQYKVIQKAGVCTTNNYSNTFTLNVVNCADLAIEQPSPQYICDNGVVTLSVSSTKRGDNTNFKWFEQVSDGNGGIIEIPTNKSTDFFQVSYGQFVVKSCLLNGVYYGVSAPVVVKGMDIQAGITVQNSTVTQGSLVKIIGSDKGYVTTGQSITYSWKTPLGIVGSNANNTSNLSGNASITTTSSDGSRLSISNFQPTDAGKYILSVSKTIGTKTCIDETNVEIVINPAGCTVDFNADPVLVCANEKGTITINTKDALASGAGLSYRVNCGAWQSSNVFSNLTDGSYLVEIQQATGSGDQGGALTCRAKSGGRSVIVKCSTLVPDNVPADENPTDFYCGLVKAKATPSSFNLEFPEPATLSVTNCTGEVRWFIRLADGSKSYFKDIHGDYNPSPVVTPTVTTSYGAECYSSDPNITQPCIKGASVTVNSTLCDNFKFITSNQLYVASGESVNLKVKGCEEDKVLWYNGIGQPLLDSKGIQLKGLSINIIPSSSTNYKAVCDLRPSGTTSPVPGNCSKYAYVTVETDDNKKDCAKYYKNIKIKRSGSFDLTKITSEQKTSITINPGDVLEISDINNVVDIITQGARNEYILEKDGTRIAYKDDPCYVFSASEVFNKYIFDGSNESSTERIPEVGSCRGAKFEFHFSKIDKNTKLETFAINRGSWGTSFGSNECSKIIDVKVTTKLPAGLNCDNFKAITSKNLVSIGEAVTLSVIGANASEGDITWKDTKGDIGSGRSIIVNPYLTKNTYTVTGGVEKDDVFLSCSAQVEVEVLPLKPLQCEDFKLSANPTLVGDGYGGSSTLTIEGCEGGVLKWIGGSNTTYTATPTKTTTYEAICYLGESEEKKEVTVNFSKFELKASPEIVGYHPSGYIENPSTTLFATGCDADSKGTLSWIGGASDRAIVYPNKTQPTTTYFATCNYANGRSVTTDVTVRYIPRYIDCNFFVNYTAKSSGTNTILSISAKNCQGTLFAVPAEGEDPIVYPYKEATWDGINPAKLEFNITTNRTILYKFICSTTGCISKQYVEFNVSGTYVKKTVPQKTNPAEICIGYSPSGQVNTYKIPISFAAGLGGADANVFNDNRQDYSKQILVSGFTNDYSSIIVTDGACMRNNGKTEWFTESNRILPAGYALSKDEYVINFPKVDTYFYGKCTYPNGDVCKTLLLRVIARPKNLSGGRVGIIIEAGTLGVNTTAAAGPCKPFKTRDELQPIIKVILKRLLDGIGCSALTLDDAKNILNKLKEQFETNTTLQKYTLNFVNIDATAQLLMNDCSSGTSTAATKLMESISANATITPDEQKAVLKAAAEVIQKVEVVTAFTYLDPTGYPFSVKLTDNDFRSAKFLYSKKDWNKNYPDYTLYGFSINGEEYKADIVSGNFRGYKTATGKQLIDSKDYTGTKQVRLIHYDGLCKMYSIIYSYQVKPKRATVVTQAELLITLTGNEGFTKWNLGDCVDVLLPTDQDPKKSNYPLLSIEQRKNFIKRRCPSSIATQIDNIEEHNIIRVIETTQDDQLTEMYNWLNGTIIGDDGRPYLACLFDHIDDAILFGPKRDDNYKNLNLVLANLAFRYKPYQDKAAQIFNNDPTLKNRVIPYTYRSIWQRMFTDPAINEPVWNFSMSNAGIVSIGGKIVTGYEVTNYDKSTVRRPNEVPIPSQTLNPLEPVLLINRSNLLSISDIGDQSGGNIVPAAMLIYVDDKARNKTILDAVDAAANIAGVVTGGIAIKAGITGIARGFAIADIANSSANLGVNYFNTTINGGNTNPKLQAVLNTWNAVNGVLGIVRTVTSLDDAINMAISTRNTRILSSHIDDYATSIINAKDELTLLSQEELAAQYVAIERFETEIELSETLANDAALVDKLKRAKELIRYDFELLVYFKSLGLVEQYYHRAAQLAKSSVIDDFAKLLVKSGTPLTDSKQFVGEIIKGQVAAKTLDNLSIKNFDEVADDIDFAITNHGNKSDIKKFFNEMLSQDEKFKAGTVGLEIIRKNPPPSYLVGARIEGFEQTFTGSANRYDLLFLKGNKKIYIDTKNYSSTSSIFDGNDNLKQAKAYFGEIENIDEFYYVIQNRSGFPIDPTLSLKKQLSDKVFNFDGNYGFYDEISTANPLIFPSMRINTKEDFISAVSKDAAGNLVNPNHSIFNILKINY